MSRSWALRSSAPQPMASPRPARAPSGAGSSWSASCSPRWRCSRSRSARARSIPSRATRRIGAAAVRDRRQPRRAAVPRRAPPGRRGSSTPRPRTARCAPRTSYLAQQNAALTGDAADALGARAAAPLRPLAELPERLQRGRRAGRSRARPRSTRASRSRPARTTASQHEDVVVTAQGLVGIVDEVFGTEARVMLITNPESAVRAVDEAQPGRDRGARPRRRQRLADPRPHRQGPAVDDQRHDHHRRLAGGSAPSCRSLFPRDIPIGTSRASARTTPTSTRTSRCSRSSTSRASRPCSC